MCFAAPGESGDSAEPPDCRRLPKFAPSGTSFQPSKNLRLEQSLNIESRTSRNNTVKSLAVRATDRVLLPDSFVASCELELQGGCGSQAREQAETEGVFEFSIQEQPFPLGSVQTGGLGKNRYAEELLFELHLMAAESSGIGNQRRQGETFSAIGLHVAGNQG